MAIAFDAATDGGNSATGTLTFAHTCTGTNRFIVVGFVGNTVDDVTGVTYNGVAMSLIAKVLSDSTRYVYLYGLVAPATGSNNVVITTSSADTIIGGALSYTGVKQEAAEASGTAAGASTHPQASVTTVTANAWVVGILAGSTNDDTTADSGTTFRASLTAARRKLADSGVPIATPASTPLGMTYTSAEWGCVVTSLAPTPETFIPKIMMS